MKQERQGCKTGRSESDRGKGIGSIPDDGSDVRPALEGRIPRFPVGFGEKSWFSPEKRPFCPPLQVFPWRGPRTPI